MGKLPQPRPYLAAALNGETNIWGRDRDREIFKHFQMDKSETETFGFSKLERDRDETESLLHLVLRPRRDLNEIPSYWVETEMRLLKLFRVGRVRDRDCLGI